MQCPLVEYWYYHLRLYCWKVGDFSVDADNALQETIEMIVLGQLNDTPPPRRDSFMGETDRQVAEYSQTSGTRPGQGEQAIAVWRALWDLLSKIAWKQVVKGERKNSITWIE